MLKVCWYGQILLKDSIFFLNDRAVSILKFPLTKFVDKIEESIEKAIQNCGQTNRQQGSTVISVSLVSNYTTSEGTTTDQEVDYEVSNEKVNDGGYLHPVIPYPRKKPRFA